ncbi:MAG: pilin [Patescibacteria group bacterium]
METTGTSSNLIDFMQKIILLIDQLLIPLIFALALLAFIWGIFNFFIAGGADEEKREKGKSFMVWGLIGFFVMVSVWGIVNLLVNTFNFGGATRPNYPVFEQSNRTNTQTNPTFPTGTSGRACQSAFDCGGLACLNGICASGQGVD